MAKHKLKKIRPGWDKYFLKISHLVSQRSTCLRRAVGAVIVKNKRILATGYNGAPTGLPHCAVSGCLRQKFKIPSGIRHELCRGLHAEMNAILQAAYYGIDIRHCFFRTRITQKFESPYYCLYRPCSVSLTFIDYREKDSFSELHYIYEPSFTR